ncbi:MAG: hypothetical protein WCV88_04130 [Patescibacteria group bacterium]|jgi:hypothetical protein
MLIFQRFTPYWTTGVVMLCLALLVKYPQGWLAYLVIVILVPISAIMIMRQPRWRFEYIGLSVPMILLVVGGYTFLLIQSTLWLQVAAVLCTGIFFFLFEKNLAVWLFQPNKYIPFSMEHISIYCNVVASFYTYVSLFMFSILRLTQLRYIFIATLLVTTALVGQTFWIQKIPWVKAKWFVLVITVVMTQLVVVLYYWPVSFFVTGIIMTLLLYVLLHLSRHHLTETLTKQLVWRYLLTCGLGLILLLATAQWLYV